RAGRWRPVKPSAQPTQVRTLDLPPLAETARDRGILWARGPSSVVSSSVIVGQETPLHHAGYGHIADGSGAEGAVHRTACWSLDGPRLPVWCGLGRWAVPHWRSRPGRAFCSSAYRPADAIHGKPAAQTLDRGRRPDAGTCA